MSSDLCFILGIPDLLFDKVTIADREAIRREVTTYVNLRLAKKLDAVCCLQSGAIRSNCISDRNHGPARLMIQRREQQDDGVSREVDTT